METDKRKMLNAWRISQLGNSAFTTEMASATQHRNRASARATTSGEGPPALPIRFVLLPLSGSTRGSDRKSSMYLVKPWLTQCPCTNSQSMW